MKTVFLWLLLVAVCVGLFGAYSTLFPGKSMPVKGALADGDDLVERLRGHVETIARDIGPRDRPGPAADAGDYLERELRRAGQDAKTSGAPGSQVIWIESPGTKHAKEIVIVASHFDGPRASPGADAGASGAAVLVEVARLLAPVSYERTLRFVLFGDGYKKRGGSDSAAAAYAKDCNARGEKIVAVLYLDSVGLFDDGPTQTYPFPLMMAFPSQANFVAVLGSYQCRDLTSKTTELLRTGTGLAIEGAVVPSFLPGTGFAPHAAFWDAGIPAVTITDTGEWRSARFATPSDTHDRLDYVRMARLALGLSRTVGLLVKKATLPT